MFSKHKFEDLYGIEFGKQDNLSIYPDRETNQFEIEFTTPNHTEDSVNLGVGMETFVWFRNYLRLEVLDGTEIIYASNRGFNFFVNKTGIDPYADQDSGHPNIAPQIRETWLKPNKTYTLRVYRTFGARKANPISIHYTATDGNEVSFATDGVPMSFNGVAGTFVPEVTE